VDNDDDEDLNQAASGALFAESCDQAPKRQKVFFCYDQAAVVSVRGCHRKDANGPFTLGAALIERRYQSDGAAAAGRLWRDTSRF
jgi:hypothetical protein